MATPFTIRQAQEWSVSRDVIARLAREGSLRRVLKGVYVDSAVPDSIDLRAKALCLVVPESAVVTDRTAGWLHGAAVLAPGDHRELPPVSVFQLPGHTRVRTSMNRGGERTLEPADVQTIRSVRVTTPLRTALDLGRLLRRYDAIAALDALLRVGGFTQADLVQELPRFKGFRGVRQLRELAPLADHRAESPPESVLRLRWIDAGLPTPQPQIPILVDGAERYRLDLGIEELRYAAEYDGEDFHTARELARDKRRRDWLRRERGWTIDVLRKQDLFGPRPKVDDILRKGVRRAQRRQPRQAA